jgi:hypothetical protein
MSKHEVIWIGRGEEPQRPPNPDYPDGIDIRSGVTPFCRVNLPYPAPGCGLWAVKCPRCGLSVGITAAGRADDPRSVELACQSRLN